MTTTHRSLRLVATFGVVALFWFAIAGVASSADPSASASAAPVLPTDSAAPNDAPSPTPAWTPDWSPSATMAINPLLIPSPGPTPAPLVSAPPIPSPIAHPPANGKNTCYDCHSAVNNKQAGIASDWVSSVHEAGGVTCADCHGGDPTSDQITVAMSPANGFIGIPTRLQTAEICASCHSDPVRMKPYGLATDEYSKYFTSVHGQLLLTNGDQRVAICTDCHGVHNIKKTTDPTAPVFPLNVPTLCASCHSDAKRMAPYGIPTNQYDVYAQSVHGVALLTNKDTRAPTCVSCHGGHDAQVPTAVTIVQICGGCHTATLALYQQSIHSQLPAAGPQCWTCHGTHDVQQPSSNIFFHPTPPSYLCSTCHDLANPNHPLVLQTALFANPDDRRCDTCHHPDSDIYQQITGIYNAVKGAESAYADASAKIVEASGLGMITSDAELTLAAAKTSLIQAQASVHTTKLATVAQLAGDAKTKADDAMAQATAKVDASNFRRYAMVAVLALILVCVAFLFYIKRRLDHELEAQYGKGKH